MILVKRDVTDPAEKPLLMAASFVNNPDGTTVLQMPDGTYAYQQVNQWGVFGFSANPMGAYQSCVVNGQLVAYHTRPEDQAYAYSWVELPN